MQMTGRASIKGLKGEMTFAATASGTLALVPYVLPLELSQVTLANFPQGSAETTIGINGVWIYKTGAKIEFDEGYAKVTLELEQPGNVISGTTFTELVATTT